MCQSRLFRCYLVALSLFGLPAFAQTPDRQTPAEEGMCDVLKAGDVTKGLYGLCVSFCEARDLAGESATIESHGGRAATRWSSRRKRFLADYNKKKRAGDPDMPCLAAAVAPSCPCWTATEADVIDGVMSDGSTARGWPAPSSSLSVCRGMPDFPFVMEMGFLDSGMELTMIQAVEMKEASPPQNLCQYLTYRQNNMETQKLLSVEEGTLTAEQLAACKSDIFARQAALGVCQ